MPSHVVAEQPAMIRDRKSIGALLAFYSYFNKLYNMERKIWHNSYLLWNEDKGGIGDNPEVGSAAWNRLSKAGRLSGSVAMAGGRTMATLAVANVLGELLSGRGPEQDETKGQWLLRKTASSPALLIPLMGGPLENVISSAVSKKHRKASIRAAPALAGVESILEAIDQSKGNRHDKWQKFWVWLEASGNILHTPNRAVTKTGSYVQRMVQHKVRVRGPGDVIGGVGWGETKNKPRNPATALQDLGGK